MKTVILDWFCVRDGREKPIAPILFRGEDLEQKARPASMAEHDQIVIFQGTQILIINLIEPTLCNVKFNMKAKRTASSHI